MHHSLAKYKSPTKLELIEQGPTRRSTREPKKKSYDGFDVSIKRKKKLAASSSSTTTQPELGDGNIILIIGY